MDFLFNCTMVVQGSDSMKDQNMKKNINTISMYGEKFYQLHAAQRQLFRALNNLVNGLFGNRVNLQ